MRKYKYQDCKLKSHEEHSLKLNFRMRNIAPQYRAMARLTLKAIILDRSIRGCKNLGKR